MEKNSTNRSLICERINQTGFVKRFIEKLQLKRDSDVFNWRMSQEWNGMVRWNKGGLKKKSF